ncbi:MAG: DASS family sodium-coupled anion symporter [Ignavibacteria bacterium]|nr:DASS family sodium-coupled anion symporter [Ignavibacteria bacterium]
MTPKHIGFLGGIFLFILFILLPVPEGFVQTAQEIVTKQGIGLDPYELASSIKSVVALLLLMVSWWLTEAVPLPATALLPAILLPIMKVVGVHGSGTTEFTFRHVLTSYAHPVIFLFLGGFLIAGAMQKWKLDQRFTLWFLTRGKLANDSRAILFGIMVVTAFLSMWISNTATTAMMLPLGLGILALMKLEPGKSNYGTALMLAIAWSASVGGIGTIIGTPTNGVGLAILNASLSGDPTYERITFLDWMKFGVPYVILFLPIIWFIVLKMNPPEVLEIPGGKARLLEEQSKLGPLSAGEKRVIVVFLLAVVSWVTNPFWGDLLPDAIASQVAWVDEFSIGLIFGLMMFVVPVDLRRGEFVMTWKDTKVVAWGTLLLFGGGLALSDAMFRSGLASWIASTFVATLGSPPTIVMLFAVVFLVDFLTEISSNTAVVSMLAPIFIAIAIRTGEDPVTIALATAVAASMAFMLPVATPPNALVYGTGYVGIKDMIRSGFMLDIAGWLFTVFVLVVIAGAIFGLVSF